MLRRCLLKAVVALIGCALVSGCGPGSQQSGRSAPAAAVSPRSQWTVTGDLQDLDAVIDVSNGTAAVSDADYAGAQITIDLGKPCLFNMVVVEHGRGRTGFSRRMKVLTSMDGENFQPRASVPGTRRVTTACLMTPVLAKYVRLKAEVPGDEPWAIVGVRIR